MDVIAAFEKVKESYINYVKTAFGTQYPGLGGGAGADAKAIWRDLPGTVDRAAGPVPICPVSAIWDLVEEGPSRARCSTADRRFQGPGLPWSCWGLPALPAPG